MDLQRLLADDEKILYQTGKHWAVFVKAILYLCLALVVFMSRESVLRNIPYLSTHESFSHEGARPVPVTQAPASEPRPASAVQPPLSDQRVLPPQTMDDVKRYATIVVTWSVTGVSIALAVIFALLGLARILGFFSRQAIITSRRVIDRDALFGGLASHSLKNVESARVASGLFGPVVGYGKVVLGMSSGRKVSLANLKRPVEFERKLFSAQ